MLFKHTLHVDPFIQIKLVANSLVLALFYLSSSAVDVHLVQSQSSLYSCF